MVLDMFVNLQELARESYSVKSVKKQIKDNQVIESKWSITTFWTLAFVAGNTKKSLSKIGKEKKEQQKKSTSITQNKSRIKKRDVNHN